tara:strand:+ start:4460 stop:5899 length:1440 start_codon:yes stop_codon:yes gene_type:complete
LYKNSKIIPVILCGGSGTRLWPKSRTSLPKQYLSFDDSSLSFLQLTLMRIKEFSNIDKPIIICNEEHRFITAEQLREIDVEAKCILLEPVRKNTCPAIALAALRSIEIDEESILLILPSDHLIKKNKDFIQIIKESKIYADQDNLITFGIMPESPETGYGYIKSSYLISKENPNCSKVEKFIEKPNLKLAEKYIKDKRFTWNSGMFLFKAKVIIKEIEKYYPEIISSCKKAIRKKINDLYFEKIDAKEFNQCPSISIDKAVMEKTNLSLVIPINIGWSDIGGWKSFWENSKKDNNGNVLLGDVIQKSGKNNLINSEHRLVVGLGIQNLIIIETNDAILIANKNYTEEVKIVVNELKEKSRIEVDEHRKIYRPWGNYSLIEESANWKVKKIEVKPFSSLSLQMHNHRAEHWVVVEGNASVEIGENIFQLKKNESCYVPIKTKHRLSNNFEKLLIIIEVQSGNYLGEDDIIRFKDDYGRDM